MSVIRYGNPLAVSQIFLSFAWENASQAQRLCDILTSNSFQVYYAPKSMSAGEDVVPYEQIAKSDVFLFVASRDSLTSDKTRNVYQELDFAQKLDMHLHHPIFVVFKLPDHELPNNWSRHLYLTPADSANVIVEKLVMSLMEHGGLYPHNNSRNLVLGGRNLSKIQETLISDPQYGLYMLNAVLPYYEMNELARILRQSEDMPKMLETLISIIRYHHKNPHAARAVEIAETLISRVAQDKHAVLSELKGMRADYSTPHLFRGETLAFAALGDGNSSIDYAIDLADPYENSPEWTRQREVNKSFHMDYYGGLSPTLRRLRESITSMNPVYLLPLDVFTLGELSSFHRDLNLLRDKRTDLIAYGVPKYIIDASLKRLAENYKKNISFR